MQIGQNRNVDSENGGVLVAALFKKTSSNKYLLTENGSDKAPLIAELHASMEELGYDDVVIGVSDTSDNRDIEEIFAGKPSPLFKGANNIMQRLLQAAQEHDASILLYIPVTHIAFDHEVAHLLVRSLQENPEEDIAVMSRICPGLESYAVRASALKRMVENRLTWPFYAQSQGKIELQYDHMYLLPDVVRPAIIRRILTARRQGRPLEAILNDKEVILEYFLEPSSIAIEPTNFCNLKCKGCPHGTGELIRPRGYMDFEKFIHLVEEEIPDYVDGVALYFYGESYLHKDIYRMTRALEHKKTSISTNCVYFQKPEHLRNILASGLSELTVCLDGACEETFTQYRTGMSFERVKDGIAMLMKLKREMGASKPVVSLQFIIMKHNMHEIERIKKIAREVGIDKLLFKKTTYQQEELGKYKREYDIFYEAFLGQWACALSTCSSPAICWDGRVAPCCVDHNASANFGNVFETPFEEILNGEKRVDFLRKLLRGNNTFCEKKNCRIYRGVKNVLAAWTLD